MRQQWVRFHVVPTAQILFFRARQATKLNKNK